MHTNAHTHTRAHAVAADDNTRARESESSNDLRVRAKTTSRQAINAKSRVPLGALQRLEHLDERGGDGRADGGAALREARAEQAVAEGRAVPEALDDDVEEAVELAGRV